MFNRREGVASRTGTHGFDVAREREPNCARERSHLSSISNDLISLTWLTTLVCAVLLTACAAPNIANNYVLDSKGGTGVATGTITYDGGYAAYRLHLDQEGTGKSYRVEHGESQTLNLVYAFKGEPKNAQLGATGSPFAVELPVGSYIVRSWQISQGAANVWSTEATNIKFDVEAGRAVYLGNFHFKETKRFGRATTAATLTLKDQAARDLPILGKTFATLAEAPIVKTLEPGTSIENVGGASAGKITIPIFIPIAR